MVPLPDGGDGPSADGDSELLPGSGGDEPPVAVDRAPARISRSLAIVFSVAAVLSVLPVVSAAALSVAGAAAVVIGLFAAHSRRLVTAGAVGQVGAAVLGGVFGLGVELVLVGSAAGVLAWDLGENAIGVGEQLGRRADTERAELVHATASVVVGVAVVSLGAAVYRLSGSEQPLSALAALVAGTVLVLWGVRR